MPMVKGCDPLVDPRVLTDKSRAPVGAFTSTVSMATRDVLLRTLTVTPETPVPVKLTVVSPGMNERPPSVIPSVIPCRAMDGVTLLSVGTDGSTPRYDRYAEPPAVER